MVYLVSLPNKGQLGEPKFLRSDDPALIARWIEAEDRPGFGIFSCRNPLKPGATRHGKDSTDAIEELVHDIDFKDVVETPEQVDEKLGHVLLPLSEIADSGHGRHASYKLKERIEHTDPNYQRACDIQAKLTEYFGADRQVRPWSLTRHPGTTNSKEDPPVPCRVLHTGAPVDLTELEELCELIESAPLLTRKPRATNGHDRAEGEPQPSDEYKALIDVDQRLADMRFKGDGDAGIHLTELQCTASLIRCGCPVDDTVFTVLEAVRKCTANDDRAQNWDWGQEEIDIRQMCCDLVNKNPELSPMLPDSLCLQFEAAIAAGRRPKVVHAAHIGWHVRSFEPKTNSPRSKSGTGSRNPYSQTKARTLELRPFKAFDVATLPPRSWLYGKHYQRKTVSLTAGPGGMGKSSEDLVEAIAMATARNLLGEQPEERLRCWYHNGEDNAQEIDRRIAAICQYYDIPQTELESWLWSTSGDEFPLRVAKGYANLEINKTLVQQMCDQISSKEIDVAFFDPLVTLHSVSEIDSGKMDAVVREFQSIAAETDCAVELTHHVRKPAAGADSDYDVHDIRGVAAITDAVRAARVLNRMNEKDAEAAGCGEIERLSRFRVDKAKGNYSPAQAAVWRQFVNVELINGDDVGVVAAWDFPGQGRQTPEKDAADRSAEQMFLKLLDKLAAQGVNVTAAPGPTHAPARLAKEKEARDAKISKAALSAAMSRLFDARRIRSESYGRSDRNSHRIVPC
jgi:RecA-family ATPase